MAIHDAPTGQGKKFYAAALVAAQFGLLTLLIAATALTWRQGTAPFLAWALWAVAVLLGVWALWANRPGNFNIRPMPRTDGYLVQHGPYRWIRHPMYTGVASLAAGCALAVGSVWAWASMALLALVLVFKSIVEERWMSDVHPEYRDYRRRTWRFIPWVV